VSSRIEDYALIGDCTTAALVSRQGSLDWLCWPQFDSQACFAALLGAPEHGRWLLAPRVGVESIRRAYRKDTLVLETQYRLRTGTAIVYDFMPMNRSGSHVVRMVFGRRGLVRMRCELILRFDYGALVPWVTARPDGRTNFIAGPHRVVLDSSVPLQGRGLKTVGDFEVRAGQRITFVLSYSCSYQEPPRRIRATAALRATEKFWRSWVKRARRAGEYSDAVRRSCITLKALTDRSTGGIVAAPTTSLPEQIGGGRNWDYRYCWLRDATFTLQAMMNAGYYQEAREWRSWLLRAAAGDPAQMQIMYGVTGDALLPEWTVNSLPGYENSRPVRIGNAASRQLQLDVYGELMDVLHMGRVGRLVASAPGWQLQRTLLQHLERIWRFPDKGIWEVRSKSRHFTYSKVMAWVALDRAIQSAEKFRLEAPLDEWRALRTRIHEDVCRRGYNARLGTFVQSYGSKVLDASLLLLPIVGFLPAHDARARRTVAAIEQTLTVDGLVSRYSANRRVDGLAPGEGVFLACSFWLADNLLLLGRRRDAERLFKRLLSLRNDVGLLSEEYDPRHKRQLGNFPQSLSHIALITTAYNLTRGRNGKGKPISRRC
jgi:GH15 family glucan-1,4-alpha-glucosidase